MRLLLSFLGAVIVPSILACGSVTTSEGGSGGGGSSSSNSSSSGAGGSGACEAPSNADVFEVGTGEACFQRLTDGQEISVIQGPQGGFHLWLAFGCGDCGAQASLLYGIKDPATSTWYNGTGANQAIFPLASGGWVQQAGIFGYLPGYVFDQSTQLPKGTHVIMSAAVLDAGGATKHISEVEVVLGDTVLWNPPCDSNPDTCGQPGGLPCCTL